MSIRPVCHMIGDYDRTDQPTWDECLRCSCNRCPIQRLIIKLSHLEYEVEHFDVLED